MRGLIPVTENSNHKQVQEKEREAREKREREKKEEEDRKSTTSKTSSSTSKLSPPSSFMKQTGFIFGGSIGSGADSIDDKLHIFHLPTSSSSSHPVNKAAPSRAEPRVHRKSPSVFTHLDLYDDNEHLDNDFIPNDRIYYRLLGFNTESKLYKQLALRYRLNDMSKRDRPYLRQDINVELLPMNQLKLPLPPISDAIKEHKSEFRCPCSEYQ